MARWISEISEYNFEIKLWDKMAHADALSLGPVEKKALETKPMEQVLFIETREEEIFFKEVTQELKL